jgi:hypothetical protein
MRYYPRQDQGGCYFCCIPLLGLLVLPFILLLTSVAYLVMR